METIIAVSREPRDCHNHKDQKYDIHDPVNIFLCLFLFIDRKPEIHSRHKIKDTKGHKIDRYMDDIDHRRYKDMIALYHNKNERKPSHAVKLLIRFLLKIKSACQYQIGYCEKN